MLKAMGKSSVGPQLLGRLSDRLQLAAVIVITTCLGIAVAVLITVGLVLLSNGIGR